MIDLIYIHLTHVPKRHAKKYRHHEFQRFDQIILSDFMINEGEAPLRFMYEEFMKLGPNNQDPILLSEIVTTSSKAEIFRFNGKRFNRLLIMLGKETIYWEYFMHDRSIDESTFSGEASLASKHCKYSIPNDYSGIIDSLRDHLRRKYPAEFSLPIKPKNLKPSKDGDFYGSD